MCSYGKSIIREIRMKYLKTLLYMGNPYIMFLILKC